MHPLVFFGQVHFHPPREYPDNGYEVRTILLCIAALSATLPAQDFTGTWQGTLRTAAGKDVRLTTKIARIGDKLTATLYTIDPRGLVAGPDVDDKVLENHMEDWNQYVRRTQDSLRTLAEETGGIALVNQNDFDKGLKRIDAETSDYYVIGYYSSNPDPLRRNRKLEIKTKREGVSVWSRTSYSLRANAQ